MKPDADYFVHESSYVDEPCSIGAGTRIWHFSHIMKDSRIGENCNIGQNVVISPGCVVGRNVKIQNNVSVYTGVILEDDVFCGPSMVFTNVVNPRSQRQYGWVLRFCRGWCSRNAGRSRLRRRVRVAGARSGLGLRLWPGYRVQYRF